MAVTGLDELKTIATLLRHPTEDMLERGAEAVRANAENIAFEGFASGDVKVFISRTLADYPVKFEHVTSKADLTRLIASLRNPPVLALHSGILGVKSISTTWDNFDLQLASVCYQGVIGELPTHDLFLGTNLSFRSQR